ncbi:MAG TPA: TIGR03808 family TAT-translocated repetitive protein, partial [Xanthobacteraceae bacterium]|nr:TIGR03808 family TAT-translocated repetitive protein [Xanthobacteraceae bacterium]
MAINRRGLFAAFAAAATAATATPALARRADDGERASEANAARDLAPRAAIDATTFGLRPNAPEDQSAAFQRAIDRAAAAHAVLHLAPGFYRAGSLKLPPYCAIAGVPGASRILMMAASFMMTATGSDYISLSGLILDGNDMPLPAGHGLVQLAQGRAVRIADCDIVNAGGHGIALETVEGEVTGNTLSAADAAIFSLDARGLRIAGNTIRSAGNGGILVWRSKAGDDGTLVVDNRIADVQNRAGGSGQHGNAINIFRADNVIVRGNRIRNAAFSAVRGNKASNLQITGNTCTGLGEVALYAEFGFEGAL